MADQMQRVRMTVEAFGLDAWAMAARMGGALPREIAMVGAFGPGRFTVRLLRDVPFDISRKAGSEK